MHRRTISDSYKRRRSAWRMCMRLLFPSPAEVQFIRVMGGKVTTFGVVRLRPNQFPLSLVWSLGPVLKAEHFEREVRVGRCFVDFGNDLRRAIEIDGRVWHKDSQAELQRDQYLEARGWRILHIPALRLRTDPQAVVQKVQSFLEN
jgi:hypothetical protein